VQEIIFFGLLVCMHSLKEIAENFPEYREKAMHVSHN